MNANPYSNRHPLSSQVTEEEIEDAETDDFGAAYSDDGRRLLRFPEEIGERIKEYTVADGTQVICDNAFEGCDNIRTIHLPTSLKVIGEMAFDGCEHLSHISLPQGLLAIGKSAWANCESLRAVSIPSSVRIIGANPFYRSGIERIEIQSPQFILENGCLIDTADGRLLAVLNGADEFSVPAAVRIIGEDAFHELHEIKRIVVPHGVEAIEKFAIVGCKNLQSIHLPHSLQAIDAGAVSFCLKLEEIVMPPHTPDLLVAQARETAKSTGTRTHVVKR